MGILDSLAMGLRSAGGIMDEGVYRGQRQEEIIQQQLQERRKDLMAQQVIRAAETGVLPPEVAQQQLAQIGYKGLTVGPDAAAQQRQEEIKRRDAISKSFGQLAPEDRANPLKVGELFIANGDPATGAKYLDLAEQRNSRREQVLATMAQRAAEMEQRSQDRALDRESRERMAEEGRQLRAQIAQGQQAMQRESLELRRVIGSQGRQPQIVQTGDGPVQVDSSGNARPILLNGQPVKPTKTATEKSLTESQAKGSLFYSQMTSANDEIKNIVGFDVSALPNQLAVRAANRDMTNWLAPEKAQQYNQAAQQWAEAYLRVKTGAAATEGEVKVNARTFFPQPGDSVSVINQKNRMRAAAEADVGMVAGPGKVQVDTRRGASSIRQQADAILGGN